MVKVMIESVRQNPAPKRIALGSDGYTMIHKALKERLAALEARIRLLPTEFASERLTGRGGFRSSNCTGPHS
jgi:hypothetical protein